MDKNEYIKSKLRVELEVNTDMFSSGFIKGWIEGFRLGSSVEKSEGTELCFVTSVTVKNNKIDEFEYCEVIKEKNE